MPRLIVSDPVRPCELTTLHGNPARIPDPERPTHLQFLRYGTILAAKYGARMWTTIGRWMMFSCLPARQDLPVSPARPIRAG